MVHIAKREAMQFRIYGLTLLGAAIVLIWYFKPAHDGKLRYPIKYQKFVEHIVSLAVVFLIATAFPLIFFGAPQEGLLSSKPQ